MSVQRIVNNDPTPRLLVSTVCRDALKETRSIERKYLLTALVELEQGTPTEIVGRIQATMTREDHQWQQGTPAKWALESAGNPQDASLSAACIWRDHRKLRRVGTRCDSDSLSASGSETGVDAE